MAGPFAVEEGVCPYSTKDLIYLVVIPFMEVFSNVKLYTYQKLFAFRIIESLINGDGAIITGLWSRQSGKTEIVAALSTGLALLFPALSKAFPNDTRLRMFEKGVRIGIYAPIEKQSLLSFDRMRKTVVSDHAIEVMEDPDLNVSVTASRGDTISFSNGSIIIARTASPQSQIEGETHHLVICEEAQKLLRSKVEKEIRPMLASTNGTMVKIGTAWESRGGFHQSIQQNLEIHKSLGVRNHFEFPYDIVIAEKERTYKQEALSHKKDPATYPVANPFHLNYKKFVDAEIARLGGTENEEFKMNFRCLWMESRVIAIPPALLKRMERPDLESGPRYSRFRVAGLDVAKTSDSTVLTIMDVDIDAPIVNMIHLDGADPEKQLYYHKTIIDWLELQGAFEGSDGQYNALIQFLRRMNVSMLVGDATGMGDPVFERIEALVGDSVQCIPYKFSAATKSRLYKYYVQELVAGRISVAAGPNTQQRPEFQRFMKQHLDLDRFVSGGFVLYSAPEDEHDDYPDSAALACMAEKLSQSMSMPTIISSLAPQGWGGATRKYAGSGNAQSSDASLPTMEVTGQTGALVPGAEGRTGRYVRRW